MGFKKKNKKLIILITIFVLAIGIGYAALSKTLKINGTSGIKKGSWSIYFDRIQNEDGVVSSETKISLDKKEVSFNIQIDKPGDFYEFEVDTVNDGSIDAMIESTELTGINDADKNTLLYNVTYDDGTDVKACDILQAGTRKKIKVRLEYSDDIDSEDLLDEQQLNIKFKINYVQNTTCEDKVTLNIDPNGGRYKDIAKVVKVNLEKNTIYASIDTPRRGGYIFQGWEKEDGTLLEQDETTNYYKVSIGTTNLTVTARWTQDLTDYVARINDDYYETIQSAIDHAVADDEIHMLKSTTESPMNNKKVVLNLEGFTVTGTLTNTSVGDIVVKNGKLTSNSVTVVNNGTFTLGVKDGDYQIDDIIIEGETIGLQQNNNFYFYDGYLQALQGIEGGCNGKEEGYYIYVDSVKINNVDYQKVYLVDHPVGNFMTINGEAFYFNSLQYAVLSTDNDHPTVYVISANPESSAAITVEEGQVLTLDTNGNHLTYGAQLTNNGTFTVTDSQSSKGSFDISLPIINNNNLVVTNAVITQTTTNGNVIQNNKDIDITASNLSAISGNVIYNTNAGTITLDSNTNLTTGGYAFNNNASGETSLTGGNLSSINQQQGTLELSNITMNSTRNTIINQTGGTLNIKSGTYNTTGTNLLYKTAGTLTIDDGSYTLTNTSYSSQTFYLSGGTTTINGGTIDTIYRSVIVLNRENLTINDATITTQSGNILIPNGSPITINGGTFTTDSGYIISNNGELTINGGTLYSKTAKAIYTQNTTTITGGTIKSDSSYAIEVSQYYTTITGGNIISTNGTAIHCYKATSWIGTGVNLRAGTVKGGQYGIQQDGNTDLTLGYNAATLDITTPVVQGELYGLYTNGNVYFYDGILKGKTKGYTGAINTKRSKHLIDESTEVIEGETYQTAYLKVQPNFLITDLGGEFNSLQDAVDYIASQGSTGTVIVTSDATYTDNTTIPNGKNITINTAGKTLNLTKSILNYGTLTLKDSLGTGHLNSTATYLVDYSNSYTNTTINIESGNYSAWTIVRKHSGTLNITGGNFNGGELFSNYAGTVTIQNATFTSTNYALNLGGTITLEDITITNTGTNGNGAVQISSGSTATLTNCNVTSNTTYAIASSGSTTIESGNYSAKNSVIITQGGTTTINGGTVTSENYYAIYNRKNMVITGGTITSQSSAAIVNAAARYDYPALTITGGTIIGATSGITNTGNSDNRNNTVTIGTNNSEIKSTPIIQGTTYGVDIATGMTFNFYDGILKGKTAGYRGIINSYPSKTTIKEGTEEIGGETYNTAYIETVQKFVRTNDNEEFNSLQGAIDHITDNLNGTGTMTIYETVSTSDPATIPVGTTVTLNLNGKQHTTTKTITNNGSLTVTDTTGGSINNNKTSTINNTGTLTINSGKIISAGHIIYSTGTVNVDGGTLESSNVGINIQGGTSYINSGNISYTGGSNNAINCFANVSGGTLNITGGTIDSGGIGTVCNYSTLNITGGTLTANSVYNSNIVTYSGSTSNISTASITNNGTQGNISNAGTTTITSGTFTAAHIYSEYAVYNSGTLTYEGGTINSEKYGLQNYSGTTTITGGNINGKTYGVYTTGGTTNIGSNDNTIYTNTPVIKGTTYGLYIETGTVNFYDGILKGQASGYTGTLNSIANNSMIEPSTELIGEDTYNTAYLVENEEYIKNNTTHERYKDINLALSQASTNDELEFVANGSVYDPVTIPDKNLTIDLHGFTLTLNKAMTNSGVTSIVDDSTNKGGRIRTTASIDLITNNNNLSISNVILNNSTNQKVITNSNGKTLTLTSCTISGNGISNGTSSTATISNTSVTTAYGGTAINNGENATLTLTNNNLSGSYASIYNSKGTIDMTGGTITATSLYAVYTIEQTTPKTDYIRNGTINGRIENYGDNLYLSGTNVTGEITTDVLLDVTGGTLNSNIKNEAGTLNATGTTINGSITSSGPSDMDTTTVNGYIANTSTMTLDDVDVNANLQLSSNDGTSNWEIVKNTGTLTATNLDITSIANYNKKNFMGIYNTGTLTYNSGTMDIKDGVTNYGIYNAGGNMTMLGGSISVSDCTTAYGVYQSSGTMIFGHLEGTGESANPSTTDPFVKAVGSTTGIGVRKADGIFRYFDGKFVGSTNAKPEAPTQIEEPDHQVTYGTGTDGYEYCILTYLDQH